MKGKKGSGLVPKHMKMIHPNRLGDAKMRMKIMKMRCWQWPENDVEAAMPEPQMKGSLKAVGVRDWVTEGKKWAEEERPRKKTSANSTSDEEEKKQKTHTPRCTIAKQPKTKTSIVHMGFFFFLSLDQKESSNAICSLCIALSAKERRVHTLEHLL